MARLIQLTAYALNGTSYASASPMLVGADMIVVARNATLQAKQSVPSASGSINSVVIVAEPSANSSQSQSYLVGETLSSLITASA